MDGEDVKIFPEIFLENAQILTKKNALNTIYKEKCQF